MRFGVAGAGFSGAVLARAVAEAGHQAVVFETRDHVAGNCHTERDPETQVMIHRYGPHIFHTGNERVRAYVNRFGLDDAVQPSRPHQRSGYRYGRLGWFYPCLRSAGLSTLQRAAL